MVRNLWIECTLKLINPLSTNPTKWSNILKQFVGNFPTNCLSVFDRFAGLALKGLDWVNKYFLNSGVDQDESSSQCENSDSDEEENEDDNVNYFGVNFCSSNHDV